MDMQTALARHVSKQELWQTIQWLTRETPYRLAGSPCQEKAAQYVAQRMEQYGLEVTNEQFFAYNSEPMYSSLEITSPISEKLDSLPCAHIRATAPEGQELELVYVGSGSYEAYQGLDVSNKMVLAEVSYAPPVPEKARIAAEMGAAGMICMNWGNDEEVICHRGLKGVWGNPTEETFPKIPDIIGIGVTRGAGLKLKALCQSGQRVTVKAAAVSDRKWSLLPQPLGILRGNGRRDEFLLVCSHLDAWQPGVTCNATGNATTLEICRILAENREKLDRDIYFVFWNGHEIAEAAGSTWFVDNHWDQINKRCVGYMHIDSTGVRDTQLFEIKASEELLEFAADNARRMLPGRELRTMSLKKIGDQSFMGIGIPSITQRMSFTKEYMDHAHGATLGWWNHTREDGLDKCDQDILELDTQVTLQVLYSLATAEILPYDFTGKLAELRRKAGELKERFGTHLDFSDLLANLDEAAQGVASVQAIGARCTGEWAEHYNEYVKGVSRCLTNVTLTYAGKYAQDSYGYGKLSYPIPLLADLERLEQLRPDCLEYGLIQTQLVRNKNRINDALYQINALTRLTKLVLVKNTKGGRENEKMDA